jgi:TetR/AcrR family fatty acid metabolism transcriptional regulator
MKARAAKRGSPANTRPRAQRAKRTRRPGGTRAVREAERRETILRAAIDVFSRKGYHGCRIADVARQAGVAYGLVYHYYENKEALLQSVFDSGWSSFAAGVQAELASGAPLAERVRGIVRVGFDAYQRDHRGVKVLILEVGRSPVGGAVNRAGPFTEVVVGAAEMFREAQRRKELSAGLDPSLAAVLLFGAIEMGLTAFILGLLDRRDPAVIARAADQVADTFLSGILGAGRPSAAQEEPTWTATSATRSKAARPG